MIKKFIIIIFFVCLVTIPVSVFSYDKSEKTIVKFRTYKNEKEAAKILGLNQSKVKKLSHLNVYKVENLNIWQKIKIQAKDIFKDEIITIEQDSRYSALLTPNDPSYSSQWALINISASSAWDITTGSTVVKIAVVDTGINGTHADLSGKVLAGYDYVNTQSISANSDSDDHGHGTAVSGAAAGIGNNSIGISGVDWNARLMPVKVLDYWGYGYSSDIALGIIYAADNGAKIINLSLGGQFPSIAIEDAINYAYAKGSKLAP